MEAKHPHYENAVYKQAIGRQTENDFAQIQPEYRGPVDPAKGTRLICAMASRLDWSHDGGPDDIVGYWLLWSPTPTQGEN